MTRTDRFWRAVGGRKVAFCLVFLVAGAVLAIKGALDWPAVTLLIGLYSSLAGANAVNTVAALRAGRTQEGEE